MAELDPVVVDKNAPDWRWLFVTRLREGGFRLSRTQEDYYIRRAYRFHGDERRAISPNDKYLLSNEFPDMYAAKNAYRAPDSERWMMEAAVLGNVSAKEIGAYLAHPESMVETYEKVFFDIREKLPARGYILNRILLPSFRRGSFAKDMDLLPKVISYCAGWEIAKEFIDVAPMGNKAREWLRGTFRDRVLKNAWNAAHRLEVNNFNAIEVMNVLIAIDALDKAGDSQLMRDEALQQITKLFSMAPTTTRPSDEILAIDEPRVMDQLVGKVTEVYTAPVEAATPVEVRDAAPGQDG